MDHGNENAKRANEIIESLLGRATPESIEKTNEDKRRRLEERSAQSDTTRRIDETRSRIRRGK